jgi:hypothetical protein
MSNFYALSEIAKSRRQDMHAAAQAHRLAKSTHARQSLGFAQLVSSAAMFLGRGRFQPSETVQTDTVPPAALDNPCVEAL